MANIATGEFAAACSNAGALGLIGSGGMDADSLRENIRRCRALTDKPFGVNIMLMHPQADEFAKIVVEEGVKLVTTGAGNPGKYMAAWKAAGITVIPVVAAAILAKHLEPLGIDAVIAEGTESGGHVGEMTTMALVPQVVDAVHVPVIAAGGIADGRGLAAALALGACGVQVGTCLLASTECPIHENYKAALLKARDSDTIVTGRIGGTPVRVLKNRMSREYVRQEKAGADKMALERFTLGSLRKAVFDGDTENGSLMAGQAAGLLHEVRPVEEIFAARVSEAKDCIAGVLNETQYTQPCMTAFAAGLTAVLREAGVTPDYAAGLSLGEYSALACAGVFDVQTAVALTAFRGKAMAAAAAGRTCGMTAVLGLDEAPLQACCNAAADEGVVQICNYNCPGQLVIGGEKAAHHCRAAGKTGAVRRALGGDRPPSGRIGRGHRH